MIVTYSTCVSNFMQSIYFISYRDSNSYTCEGHEDDDHTSMDLDVVPYAKKVFSAKGVEGRGHDVREFLRSEGAIPYHIIL
jgi:hypothetical protein